jgi:hypothetical protein
MKARTVGVLLVLASVLCLGMGGLSGTNPNKFPHPSKNFKAVITDTLMTRSDADLVSCDGATKLPALRGETRVRIPFEKISRIAFVDYDNRYRTATVTFWNGEVFDIQVRKFLVCTGRTNIGEVFIKVQNMKEVVFEKGEYSKTDDDDSPAKAH